MLYLAGILFMFLGIAIVCDDFFVASLEAISTALDLSDDVAGAPHVHACPVPPRLQHFPHSRFHRARLIGRHCRGCASYLPHTFA